MWGDEGQELTRYTILRGKVAWDGDGDGRFFEEGFGEGCGWKDGWGGEWHVTG
jgi:hypothetical protein